MKLPASYRNPISLLGTIIAVIAAIVLVILLSFQFSGAISSAYFSIFSLIMVPGILFFGLLLISFGMYRTWKKMKKQKIELNKYPHFDLNDKKTRNAAIIFITVTAIFVLMTVLGSIQAVHYTESVSFCGQVCHTPMNPEFTAYQNSPHARVRCSECHVGEGIDHFIQSKMSGMRQLWGVITGNYNRPIETPIHNLRPAAETCEKCHWPQKFYTQKIRNEKYFITDSSNTEWFIALNMKIGADHQSLGLTKGIHWHINPDIEIEYKANRDRETIPWVKYKNKKTGKEIIYTEPTGTVKEDSLAKLEHRKMDCMDCHNRPSHEFRSPTFYVNSLFASGKISTSIPYLKKAAMEALKVPFGTSDSAKTGISEKMIKFYKDNYASVYDTHKDGIHKAIVQIKEAYAQNAFPEMKVTFDKYPRHIGHIESDGCFRCHNDKHKSADGKVISKDCNLCHTIVAQGKKGSLNFTSIDKTVEFVHPVDIDNAWKESNCMECHVSLY